MESAGEAGGGAGDTAEEESMETGRSRKHMERKEREQWRRERQVQGGVGWGEEQSPGRVRMWAGPPKRMRPL